MATANASSAISMHIKHMRNFMGFAVAYVKKNNPIKLLITGSITYIQELLTVNKKITRIQNRINYERYKLKKTELILAQNSEHVFLKGRSLNQTR